MTKSIEYQISTEFIDQGKDIPIGSLVKYMLEVFPDSCFSYNWGKDNDNRWDDNLIIVNAYQVFRYEILDWCGCGDVEGSDDAVRYFLTAMNGYDKRADILEINFGTKSIYNNPLLLCLAYTMDAAGFTEHGSGIGGAWLEPRGKIYLWILNKMKEIKGYDLI